MRHSLLLMAVLAAAIVNVAAITAPTPNGVSISGRVLTVDGQPFKVKGMAYSPVPIGENVDSFPHGDYFTPDYAYLWSRDLPQLKANGINTLRIYGWNNGVNHQAFLDACHQFGLKLVLTHYVGTANGGTDTDSPVDTPAQRQAAIDRFVAQVKLYGDHPAILSWSFGNELNGIWNGFIPAFDSVGSCGWTANNCNNNVQTSGTCFVAQDCLYKGFFGWLNDAMTQAKEHTTRPLTSTFADVDNLITGNAQTGRIPLFDKYIPAMDFYAIQLYRGRYFGDYFNQYGAATSKPLLVGEYGIDAYNDECGWDENANNGQPCFNYPGSDGKGGSTASASFVGCAGTKDCNDPGEVSQQKWDVDLTAQIQSASQTIGGILMEWTDEYWKNIHTQDFCVDECPPDKQAECADPNSSLHATFTVSDTQCQPHAHVSCPNFDTSNHDLCGYYLQATPDNYVNEAWFGVNGLTDCKKEDTFQGHRLTALAPRPVLAAIKQAYGGPGGADETPQSCADQQACWDCVYSQRTGTSLPPAQDPHSAPGVLAGACDSVCRVKFTGLYDTDENPNPGDGGNTNPGGDVTGNKGAAGMIKSSLVLVAVLAIAAMML